jgi:hypothetical protein
MQKEGNMNRLAQLVYEKGLISTLEQQAKSKYEKRIEYLVNANNELMYELEQCELECYGRGYEGTTTTR